MANSTSKTTKAKTKITKKSVAASRSVAAEAVKKPVKPVAAASRKTPAEVAKSSAGKSVVPIVTANDLRKLPKVGNWMNRLLTAEGLRKANLVSAVVFAVLALLALLLMNDTAYQLLRGHLTADALASQSQTVFAPAHYVIANLEVRWLVAATLLVSAALAAWRYYNDLRERRALADHISPWRWFDAALTGALMLQVAAFLSGMQEVVTLMLLGALVASSAVFAWITERENAGSLRVVRGALTASFVTGALALLAVNAYAVATVVYGMVRAPWYVYALYVLLIATAAALVLIQVREYRRAGAWANYLFVERNYALLNVASKVLFAVILIVGLHK